MSDEAESRAYSRGYAAGRRRARAEEVSSARTDFWERVVVAVAPVFLDTRTTYVQGEKKLISLPDRAQLAVDFANYVLKHRPKA